MAYIINFAETSLQKISTFKEYYNIEYARNDMKELFTNLFNHKNSNEYQPTTFGKKDYFHFYVKQEDGVEEKRAFFITKKYKTKKYSCRTFIDKKNRANELGLPCEYY